MRRIAILLLGCLAASLAAGLSGAAILTSLVWLRDGEVAGDWLSAILVFGAILTVYGMAASVTLGMLAHVLLTRLRRTGWVAYLLAGLGAGALVGMLFGGPAEFAVFGTGLGAGAAGALAFRAVVWPRVAQPTPATA